MAHRSSRKRSGSKAPPFTKSKTAGGAFGSSRSRFTPEQQAENFERFRAKGIKSSGRLGSRSNIFQDELNKIHRSLRSDFFGVKGDRELRKTAETLNRLRKVRRNRVGFGLALLVGTALAFRGTAPKERTRRPVGRPRSTRSVGRPRAKRRVGRPTLNRR